MIRQSFVCALILVVAVLAAHASRMVDSSLFWAFAKKSELVEPGKLVLVEVDEEFTQAGRVIPRAKVAELLTILARHAPERVYFDLAQHPVRKPEEDALLAQAVRLHDRDRLAFPMHLSIDDPRQALAPAIASMATVVVADIPVRDGGFYNGVGPASVARAVRPTASSWLAGRPSLDPTVIHPKADLSMVKVVAASSLLSEAQARAALPPGAIVIVAEGPDITGQRLPVADLGRLTRGQTVALTTLTSLSGREPMRLAPLFALALLGLAALVGVLTGHRGWQWLAGGYVAIELVALATAAALATSALLLVPSFSLAVSFIVAGSLSWLASCREAAFFRAFLANAMRGAGRHWADFFGESAGVVLFTPDGTQMLLNAHAAQLLGLPRRFVWQDAAVLRTLGLDPTGSVDAQTVECEHDGKPLRLTGRSVVQDRDVAAQFTITDLSEARLEQTQLKEQAESDALTGLLNISGLKSLFGRAAENFTLVLVDLDGFKPINDRLGHAAGDHVLKTTAQRLETLFPRSVARVGGDEFVLLLDSRHVPDPAGLQGWIRDALSQRITYRGNTVSVGASVGVHTSHRRVCKLDEALEQADLAMYADKRRRNGRRPFVAAAA